MKDINKRSYVLQVGMTRNIGGLETYLMQQFNHLDKEKIMYDFVNITAEYDIVFKNEIISNNGKIYNVCSRHINPIKHYYQWIRILCLYGKKYKAIILNANSLEYVFPLFIAKLFRIPTIIIHSHNAGHEHKINTFRKILIRFNEYLLNFSVTDYWACSELAGKWMFGENRKYKVIHNAIDVNKFKYNSIVRKKIRQVLNLENKFVIGHVAKFSYQKNHEFLIDIFYEVHKKLQNAVLLLIGDAIEDKSYLNSAKEKIRKLKLEENVQFLGMRSDTNELYQAMDCFVFPSRFEGLGIVAIEAQTAGLPCYLSSVIPFEVKITNLVEFVSLEDSPEIWADKIIGSRDIVRKDTSMDIRKAGYDIDVEIKKLEDFYLDTVN